MGTIVWLSSVLSEILSYLWIENIHSEMMSDSTFDKSILRSENMILKTFGKIWAYVEESRSTGQPQTEKFVRPNSW